MKRHLKSLLCASIAVTALAACQQPASDAVIETEATEKASHWGYEGEDGPAKWGDLSKDYATCKTGTEQSPIDLPAVDTAKTIEVATNYAAAAAEIVNNGHTIQANFGEGFALTSGDKDYKLLQFHMHTPSEHTIAGQSAPMVAHFVHADADGKLAVLGILFETGEASAPIQSLIDNIDGTAELDLMAMLPANLNVVNYQGSLTTPPCSEGVNWHVATQSVTASAEQIDALNKLMKNNARPVQPLGERQL